MKNESCLVEKVTVLKSPIFFTFAKVGLSFGDDSDSDEGKYRIGLRARTAKHFSAKKMAVVLTEPILTN